MGTASPKRTCRTSSTASTWGESGKSGIGLALTKEIIHLHRGTIRAYNGDTGAVFEITLPTASIRYLPQAAGKFSTDFIPDTVATAATTSTFRYELIGRTG
ncbi:MAG: hypothetical protein ACLU3I_18415 [Acutalibacteraceae bacterium]